MDEPTLLSLEEACMVVLGRVLAISPSLYGQSLEQIARLSGKENSDDFKKEIRDILAKVPSYID